MTANISQIRRSSMDGLQNVMSGLGTDKMKRSYNRFVYSAFNDLASLDTAYQTNWIARKVVDIPAEDMTREWRTIKCKDADTIRIAEDKFMLPVLANEAISWARLYGGAGILMLTDQDLEKPLNINIVKKDGLKRLIVLDRYDMQAITLNTWDVLAENYLMPEYYNIRGGQQRIHWTHFARFCGAKLPLRQRAQTQGWGDSELRKCMDDVMDMVAAKDGIAEMMQEANIDIIKREGLSDELASDQDDMIIKRYQIFSLMKSVANMGLLDGDESMERMTLNLSGVAPIIQQFMIWICGAADVPVTRFFGQAASGLNATGEGDERNYFNKIRSSQLTQLDPGMRRIDEVLVRSALGSWPDDFNYAWNPLRQLSATEMAAAAKTRADKHQILVDMGAARVSQVMRVLQADEEYDISDEDIERQEMAENDMDDDDEMPDDNQITETNPDIEQSGGQL